MSSMLTISQLAAYAGVTVAAVRHYHKVGLLPEPDRDRSGYRNYDAAAVVRLIRIRVLANAGVPLAHVESLLDAEPEDFAESIRLIDKRLRSQIRSLQQARERLTQLASGEHLALPKSVVGYLDRLRSLGVDESYIEKERDAWIIVAANIPATIDAVIAQKHADLDDPVMVRLYTLLSTATEWDEDDPRIVEVADLVVEIITRVHQAGDASSDDFSDGIVNFLDATMIASSPVAKRLIVLLNERGWKGWTRVERVESGD